MSSAAAPNSRNSPPNSRNAQPRRQNSPASELTLTTAYPEVLRHRRPDGGRQRQRIAGRPRQDREPALAAIARTAGRSTRRSAPAASRPVPTKARRRRSSATAASRRRCGCAARWPVHPTDVPTTNASSTSATLARRRVGRLEQTALRARDMPSTSKYPGVALICAARGRPPASRSSRPRRRTAACLRSRARRSSRRTPHTWHPREPLQQIVSTARGRPRCQHASRSSSLVCAKKTSRVANG